MRTILSRRDFLKIGAVGGAAVALPIERFGGYAGAAEIEPFRVPLRVPPRMEPVKRTATTDYYEVTMCKAKARILPGAKTRIWGFDGIFPGPTIKAKRGREIVIRRKNTLPVPVSTHLHGGEVPSLSDGHPSRVLAPGQSYDYVYPNLQEAATLWYHDHTCNGTSKANYMGLSGFYILKDDAEKELNLPKGRFDVPLLLQDRSFKRDNSFKFRDKVDEVLGDVLLVNGRPMPFMRVAARKYRFRLLNGSHTRGYTLALDNGEPLTQIASDQGLLATPYPASSIPLWPSERAEVVIDFAKYPVGSRIVLQDLVDPSDPSSGVPVMQFRVVRESNDPTEVPTMLKDIERLLPGPGTVQREFDLSKDIESNKWVINGKPFDAGRVDIEPRLGDTEIWTFRNNSTFVHPMHVHLTRFQILDRSNLALHPGEVGWKDTVRVDPSATVRIIMRWEGFTGRYMFHCHNLAHEDHSMMGTMMVREGSAGEKERSRRFEGGYVRDASAPPLGFRCDLPI